MAGPVESDTLDRILDAAERLFHQRGFSGTSLRAVTAAAGVNVAAVHYHLGSKKALLAAVIERRAAPMNRERLARLERVLAQSDGAPPSVEKIVAAFLGPAMDSSRAQEIRDVSTLVFREPVELVMPLLGEIFAGVSDRFVAALARALPHLGREELNERFQYVLSVMVQVLSGRVEIGVRVLQPDAPAPSSEALFASVCAFVVAGLRAPSSRPAGAAG